MEAVFLIAILVMSVVIHEVSHGYAANLLGDPTARLAGRLTLNPLKHLDPFGSVILPALLFWWEGFVIGWAKPVPFNPYNLRAGRLGPAYVAAAGPAANILLAICFALFIRLGGAAALGPGALALAAAIIWVNIILAVFNLLPVPPLDGSKLLFALLPWRYRFVEDWLTRYQLFLILILLYFLLTTKLLFFVVSFFFKLLTGLPGLL